MCNLEKKAARPDRGAAVEAKGRLVHIVVGRAIRADAFLMMTFLRTGSCFLITTASAGAGTVISRVVSPRAAKALLLRSTS
jgi:hypothetical protein